VLAALLLVLTPRPASPGTAVVLLASGAPDRLAPVQVELGGTRLTLAGDAPQAPRTNPTAQLSLAPGTYPVRIGGSATSATLTVTRGAVEPLLLAVRGGTVVPGGVYAGVSSVNLGLQELSGRLKPISDFHLVDHDGRPLDRSSLLGKDTVIAAFHTTCRETCPLYSALLFQIRRSAPGVRLIEVTTDPATDTPATLAAYRTAIAADWTFATGTADELTEFWAPLGVGLATGDTHESAIALVDRHGFIRSAFTGIPDVGGQLPATLQAQLDDDGRQVLAGHGDRWGAPQVLDSLRALAAAGQSSTGSTAPVFSLDALDGRRVSLEELRGRPVIINFWWSGCPPCREELPLLQRYADGHPRATLLLVDPVDGIDTARGYAQSLNLRATVLLDRDSRVRSAYHVPAYPTTVFVHTDGSIASTYTGELTPERLTAHVSNLGAG
jgi:cytochrome oxidase Cu insertion factor (SCO1/SenC/PrrC family)